MKRLLWSTVLIVLVLGFSYSAGAQTEVTLIAPAGIRAPISKLIPMFESKSQYQVKPTYGSGGSTKQQVIKGGGDFDVPVVQAPYEPVIASGNVVPDSRRVLASIAFGLAVKKGAAKPDISTAAKFKKVLLAANSISGPDPADGASMDGVSFIESLKKIGLYDRVQSKLKLTRGAAGALAMVAKGDVEIGFAFMSEMQDPGIDVVGALPKSVFPPTELSGFVSSHSKEPQAAKALLDFLSSHDAAAVYREAHMNPGR